MENLVGSDGRKREAIEELVRGHEFASQLRELISNRESCGGSDEIAEDLLGKVLRSFTNTLLLLNNKIDSNSRNSWKPSKSEDSQESTSIIKHPTRASYKRSRRTSQTLERESEAPIEDGYQWRKYGQKRILDAKHPRNYYRCTHKFDQGCHATKHVQQIQDQPPLFKTTYYGTHTCKNLLEPEIISDYGCGSERLISFASKLPTKQDLPFLSSSSSTKKSECKEEIIYQDQSSISLCPEDYLISDHELTFDSSCCCKHLSLSSSSSPVLESHLSQVLCDFVQLDSFEPFEF